MALTVAQLARAGGVGVETIRYYQRLGLMSRPASVGKTGTGIRHYDERDVRRLRFIRGAQTAGFKLQEIERLLELEQTNDRVEVREIARNRIAMLDAQIATMQKARGALARLAHECERSGEGPCPILGAFDV